MANNRHRRIAKLKKQEADRLIAEKIDSYINIMKVLGESLLSAIKILNEAADKVKVCRALAEEYNISPHLVLEIFDQDGCDVNIENGREIINSHFGLE